MMRCSRDHSLLASNLFDTIKIIDLGTGETTGDLPNLGLPFMCRPAWSPEGNHVLAWASGQKSYHVISRVDGSSQEYDLSDASAFYHQAFRLISLRFSLSRSNLFIPRLTISRR